ncbi:MAG: low molecular weight protein arginine phosphatase [Clostridia bacterium]
MKRLLFVCTGNTCRSSMAEGLAKEIFNNLGLSEWEIHSAGTYAIRGQKANPKAIKVAFEEGIDLSEYKSKSIPANINDYDLVLTMTKSHKRQIEELFELDDRKLFMLNKFAYGTEENVVDPFGKEIDAYRETFTQLKEALKKVANKIKKQ